MPDGRVRFELRRKRVSGETHLVFEPLAFLRRLAWLIPPPRVHLLWYHGVFAPASKLRARVVPKRSIEDLGLHHPPELEQGELAPKRGTVPCCAPTSKRTWAQLLSRVCGIDALQCEDCGARMRVIAAVQEASEVRRILEHLGLPHEVPTVVAHVLPRDFGPDCLAR
jgi:hypothetical protein